MNTTNNFEQNNNQNPKKQNHLLNAPQKPRKERQTSAKSQVFREYHLAIMEAQELEFFNK